MYVGFISKRFYLVCFSHAKKPEIKLIENSVKCVTSTMRTVRTVWDALLFLTPFKVYIKIYTFIIYTINL